MNFEENNNKICFYNLLENKIITSLSNISKYNGAVECFIRIQKIYYLFQGKTKYLL